MTTGGKHIGEMKPENVGLVWIEDAYLGIQFNPSSKASFLLLFLRKMIPFPDINGFFESLL